MLCTLLIGSLHLPLQFIRLLFFTFCVIFRVLYVKVLSFLQLPLWRFMHTLMLIGLVTQLIISLLLVVASSQVDLLFHGRVKNRKLFLDLPLRLSVVLWQLPQMRLSGCVGYQQIWVYLLLLPLLFTATTKVSFKLLAIQFFMNRPNTLISIVILLDKNSSMGRLLYPLSLLPCRLSTSSQSLKLFNGSLFLLANSRCFYLATTS